MAPRRTWIEVALNGPWGRALQPGIPIGVDEIVREGLAAAEAGAAAEGEAEAEGKAEGYGAAAKKGEGGEGEAEDGGAAGHRTLSSRYPADRLKTPTGVSKRRAASAEKGERENLVRAPPSVAVE